MSKKTREEKREEERRIIAEMEAAIQEKEERENPQSAPQERAGTAERKPQPAPASAPKSNKGKNRYHCPRCKTLLQEDGKCVTCGYKMYIPMDEKKRNKIRLIVAVVCMVIFAVLFVILQFKK
ncbi:MAG: hypothetical protein IJ308_02335 [Clostridia bacterium]|nr:hypothetical protein [Clostridia bacterium]